MTTTIPKAEDLLAARHSTEDLLAMARDLSAASAASPSDARHEPVRWVSAGIVEKWDRDQTARAMAAYKGGKARLERADLYALVGPPALITEDPPSNILVNNGINRLLNLLIGTGSIGNYANGTARIGVGNGSSVASTDTDLSAAAGSSNRYFQPCAGSYPSVSGQTLTAQATFGTGDGNFAWSEWGIDGGGGSGGTTVGTNGASNSALLNHKAATLGTKASGSTWTLTVTIVVS